MRCFQEIQYDPFFMVTPPVDGLLVDTIFLVTPDEIPHKVDHYARLKRRCDARIRRLCAHVFEDDCLDTGAESSERVCYCVRCGCAK